ncbi:MAG: hypothetical protein ACRD26_12070 [Vicinamibacterales bacterium]
MMLAACGAVIGAVVWRGTTFTAFNTDHEVQTQGIVLSKARHAMAEQ